MSVPEDVGCKNNKCINFKKCKRAEIFRKNIAREVKSFGGTPQKGCGKFIPMKESSK